MHFRFNKLLVLIFFSLVFNACSSSTKKAEIPMLKLRGKTMGTTYSVLYRDSLERDFSPSIDSLLKAYNQEVSTYIKNSKISAFNQSKAGLELPEEESIHFLRNFNLAKKVYQETEGWFNPAVMPLVNYWGFGYTEKKAVENVDSTLIDSLLLLVNFDSINAQKGKGVWRFSKVKAAQQLDFSAIAKGDGVDEIGRFLEQQGLKDYMVEIGGEVRARGFQQDSLGWLVGINTPKAEASTRAMQAKVALDDMSLATSGNYRNFHEVNGVKYAHTINPHSGYPEQNHLLSVSIFAKDCALADALATACMAMGLEKAWTTVENLEGVEAYFIYSDDTGTLQVKMTPKVQDYLR